MVAKPTLSEDPAKRSPDATRAGAAIQIPGSSAGPRGDAVDVEHRLPLNAAAAKRIERLGEPRPRPAPAHLRIELAALDLPEQCDEIAAEGAAVRKHVERLDTPAAALPRALEVD